MKLGLDISTTCTGFCVYDNEKKEIINKGVVKMEGELFERVNILKEKLDELLSIYEIDIIDIEDFLMKFPMGRSSAFVINKLVAFNSIISYYLWDKGYIIKRHNVKTARKRIFGMASNKSYKNGKEFVLAMLKKKLGQEYIDTLPVNTRGNLAKESYDINDAVVMALQ